MSVAAERRYGSLGAGDVAALDAAAASLGVDVVQLMEVAGWQVARFAWRMLGERPADVAVVSGRGNNGGDGLVAARHLRTWGCVVRAVVVAAEGSLREVVDRQLAAARGAGVEVSVSTDPSVVTEVAAAGALVLDGLLGTGLSSAPREPDASAIRALHGRRVLSIDVPSGMDASGGQVFDPCVHAESTCTLTAAKAGFWTKASRSVTGSVVVADIGMPATAWAACSRQPPTAIRGGAILRLPGLPA